MRNLIECYSGDDLHIMATRYLGSTTKDNWVRIDLSDGTNSADIRMSEAQARDLLGTLANELAQYADVETVTPPIEATYTATDEGKAAITQPVCDNCGERVGAVDFYGVQTWRHVNEDGAPTTYACDPDDIEGLDAEVNGSDKVDFVPKADDVPAPVELVEDEDGAPLPFAVGDWVTCERSSYERLVSNVALDEDGDLMFTTTRQRTKGDRISDGLAFYQEWRHGKFTSPEWTFEAVVSHDQRS